MNKNKGFTLIELLVVIAIIGILASVVLAALSSARSKGQDAAVQSQLSSMRAQAELYYSTTGNNSYGTLATSYTAPTTAGSCTTGTNNLFVGANGLATLLTATTTTKDCGAGASSWSVAAAGVSANTAFCVDGTGVSRSKNSAGTAYTGVVGVDGTPVNSVYAHQTAGQVTCS